MTGCKRGRRARLRRPSPTKPRVSTRRLAANRRNARRSTGPKSAEGKARSALNAVGHGLNRAPLHDVELTPELHALAERLCAGDPARYSAALRAVEAGVQLDRVFRLRRAAIEAVALHVDAAPAVLAALPRLETLDRYEAAARVRRRRALLQL